MPALFTSHVETDIPGPPFLGYLFAAKERATHQIPIKYGKMFDEWECQA